MPDIANGMLGIKCYQFIGVNERIVGYNVQTAVEAENHLIVAHEVTMQGYDRDALSSARQDIAQQYPERG